MKTEEQTTYMNDFAIAERFGEAAIKDTFTRCIDQHRALGVEYLAESFDGNSEATFAESLHHLMGSRGISAKELSDLSGVPQPYISKLLSGKVKEPTWHKACAIINALGVSPNEFLKMQQLGGAWCPPGGGGLRRGRRDARRDRGAARGA